MVVILTPIVLMVVGIPGLPCHPILWDTSVGIHILSVLHHRHRDISRPPFHYVSLAPAFALAGHGGLSFLTTNWRFGVNPFEKSCQDIKSDLMIH